MATTRNIFKWTITTEPTLFAVASLIEGYKRYQQFNINPFLLCVEKY
jgi:hypothetical protein